MRIAALRCSHHKKNRKPRERRRFSKMPSCSSSSTTPKKRVLCVSTAPLEAFTFAPDTVMASPSGSSGIKEVAGAGRSRVVLNGLSLCACACYRSFMIQAASSAGSSTGWEQTLPILSLPDSFGLSYRDLPWAWNWNLVLIGYCDGASFTGDVDDALSWKGQRLYSRGRRILDAIRRHIAGIADKASDVIVGGCGSGGVAAFQHVDAWRAALPVSARVVGLSISGFMLDVPHGLLGRGLKWIHDKMNTGPSLLPICLGAYATEPWRCMLTEHMAPYVQTPLFVYQSRFDAWQVRYNLQSGDLNRINEFGSNVTTRVATNLLLPLQSTDGTEVPRMNAAFLSSCSDQCLQTDTHRVDPLIDQTSLRAAFEGWFNGIFDLPGTSAEGRRLWLDWTEYPCETCCGHAVPRT
mmetsp:Transcript_45016/g.97490  ORF Transcript_45016/g.97490 Transcript_45016/m.97490 type:complete len:408 (+) Transcript_45016:206-1429(+)